MDFSYSRRTTALQQRLLVFMDDAIYPSEQVYADQIATAANRWESPPIMEQLKTRALAAGLWNLFLPDSDLGAGLSNLEYAPLCEILGRSPIAPEACNCSAPDTGNMEVLVRYGTDAHKRQWLTPLLEGTIRSAYTMTEPEVASSDATNIGARIERDGDSYVINAHKWWASGAGDTRCKIFILMGKTDPVAPTHQQQSMILVPADTPGVTLVRPLTVFGYDHAPHGHFEITFEDVRVPRPNHDRPTERKLLRRTTALQQRLLVFMDDAIYPSEQVYADQIATAANRWESPPIMEQGRTVEPLLRTAISARG